MGRPAKFDREAAIETAMHRIWRDGLAESSVKALSEALGITRSSFYNAFESREALFEKVVALYAARSPDNALLNADEDARFCPLVTRVMHQICRSRAADPQARGCLVVNMVAEISEPEHPIGQMAADYLLCSVDRIEAMMARAVATGELPADYDLRANALALQALVAGLNVLCKVVREEAQLWAAARAGLQGLGLYDPSDLDATDGGTSTPGDPDAPSAPDGA